MPMRVRIPYASKLEHVREFQDMIREASAACGLSYWKGLQFAILLFEQIALAMGQNRKVTIPTFGMFAPKARKRRKDGQQTVFPAFSGSRVLRKFIHDSVPPTGAAVTAINAHTRQVSGHARSAGNRDMRKSVAKFQEALKAMARKEGRDLDDP